MHDVRGEDIDKRNISMSLVTENGNVCVLGRRMLMLSQGQSHGVLRAHSRMDVILPVVIKLQHTVIDVQAGGSLTRCYFNAHPWYEWGKYCDAQLPKSLGSHCQCVA